jgi:deoxyribodipyrimidine photo-lyase
MPTIIHWFRRDLRLDDNTALAAAASASGGTVLPLFVLDDRLLRGRFASPARTRFLLQSLQALDAELRARGSQLIFRRGEPLKVLLELAGEVEAAAVYWNRDYSPFAVERDKAVKSALKDAGLDARSFKDAVIFEMDEISSLEGKPYTVYTPYARRWRQHLEEQGFGVIAVPDLACPDTFPRSDPIPDLEDLGMHTAQDAIPGGAEHGHALLQRFTDQRRAHSIADYKAARDLPALPATSRLSAHLRLGTVSPRMCLRAAFESAENEKARLGADTCSSTVSPSARVARRL